MSKAKQEKLKKEEEEEEEDEGEEEEGEEEEDEEDEDDEPVDLASVQQSILNQPVQEDKKPEQKEKKPEPSKANQQQPKKPVNEQRPKQIVQPKPKVQAQPLNQTQPIRPKKVRPEKDEEFNRLLQCNLENDSKEDMINLLMATNMLKSDKNAQEDEPKDESLHLLEKTFRPGTMPRKYMNVRSQYTVSNLYNTKSDLNKLWQPMVEENTPEAVEDFEQAKKRIIMNNKNNEDGAFQILISSKHRQDDPDKVTVTRQQIHDKVTKTLEDRKAKIEKIKEKLEEKEKEHTYQPVLVAEKNMNMLEKRNLDAFYSDQMKHLKKFDGDILLAKDKMAKAEKNSMRSKPLIEPNSDKIFREIQSKKQDLDKEVNIRLYNQRNKNKQKLIDPEQDKDIKPKSGKRSMINSTLVETEIQKKIKGMKAKKGGRDNKEYVYNVLYEKARQDHEAKISSLAEKYNPIVGSTQEKAASMKENKYLFDRFSNDFNTEVNQFKEEDADPEKAVKLRPIDMFQILEEMGFTTFNPFSENISMVKLEEEQEEEKKIDTNKKAEIELMREMHNSLVKNNYVNSNHLKEFMFCIIGLHENFSKVKKDMDMSPLERKKDDDEQLEENGPAEDTRLHLTHTEGDSIEITPLQANKIRKRFSILYLNSLVHKSLVKQQNLREGDSESLYPYTHRPQINKYSEEIYSEYLRKINETYPIENQDENDVNPRHKEKLDYIERLIIKKRKKENQNKKLKEEMDNMDAHEYTFTPNLEQTKGYADRMNKEREDDGESQVRYEQLYKLGVSKVSQSLAKRDPEEREFSKQKLDCTFNPTLDK